MVLKHFPTISMMPVWFGNLRRSALPDLAWPEILRWESREMKNDQVVKRRTLAGSKHSKLGDKKAISKLKMRFSGKSRLGAYKENDEVTCY